MTTIPITIKNISQDIQNASEELIKLLIRKSIKPVLNPINKNGKVVYNNYLGRYERGLVGSACDDNINKYTYTLTRESLGWTDEILVNFRITPKFMKNNPNTSSRNDSHAITKSKMQIAFTDKERNQCYTKYNNFLRILSSRNVKNIISEKNSSLIFTTNIPYTHSFKQLESIGKDIIDQTDPSISGEESAQMSTATLRVKLYLLEQSLANLSVEHPHIYDSYIEMMRLINSKSQKDTVWMINLIAALSYQRWSELSEKQKRTFIDALGEDFVDAFVSNELITILLQSDDTKLILTSAYLYPLLKMLFIVFGYSRLVPTVINSTIEPDANTQRRHQKHIDKYRGASYRRGDLYDNDNSDYDIVTDTSDSASDQNPERYRSLPDVDPVDQYIYQFIRLFGDLYPTIIGLMGGTETFPPEAIEVNCNDIPQTYRFLKNSPEYLWRFNDYSYCRYLEYIYGKQKKNALKNKINDKVRYLNSF